MNKLKLVFIIFQIFHFSLTHSQINITSFKNLNIDDGLSNNNISQIFQDEAGFIWIGTEDGLNKYDGYSFKVYRNIKNDSSSLSSSNIKCVFQDSKGRLWIGTNYGGLNLYNKEKDSFIRCVDQNETDRLKRSSHILSIVEDVGGNIWLGTFYSGLIKYDPESKTFEQFFNHLVSGRQYHPRILSLEVADSANLLVTIFKDGFYAFNLKTNEFKRIPYNTSNNEYWRVLKDNDSSFFFIDRYNGIYKVYNPINNIQISGNPELLIKDIYFRDICKDFNGNLWMASAHGLYVKTKDGVSTIKNNPINPYSLSDNLLTDVFADNNKGIWIGTGKHGLSYFSYNLDKFKVNTIEKFKVDELFNVQINDIVADDDGSYWLATEGKGICHINPKTQLVENYTTNNTGLKMNGFTCIHVDTKTDGIWIGSTGGLSYFDKKTKEVKLFSDNKGSKGTNMRFIQTIFEDKDGQLWFGLNGGGINKYNRKSETFSYFLHDIKNDHSISSNGVTAIFVDKQGHLWFGTRGAGLNLLDQENDTFHRICILCSKNSIYDDVIINIINQNSFPGLWIGTSAGLVYYNHKTGLKKSYSTFDGLPDNSINSIEIDAEGNLWLGTNNGVSKAVFNQNNKELNEFSGEIKFVNYNKKDGFLSQTILLNSSCRANNGDLVFGTLKGFVSFKPEDIKASEFEPEIVITQLRIGDKIVGINDTINEQVVLSNNISTIEDISLNYLNRNFSIDFAALDYSAPLHIKYRYILDGYDKEWRTTFGAKRTATYTNLDPGTYKLLIKSSNSDGIWSSKIKELIIKIIPPWWQTWWAFLIYGVVILILFAMYFSISNSRISLKKTLEFEKKSREKEEELSQLKSRFFTNITHEFKTPLSLILGPADQLIKELPDDSIFLSSVRSIRQNATRLLNLINELLSIRKIETGKEKLNVQETDIVSFSQSIARAFEESSKIKGISFKTNLPSESIKIYIDPVKIEKILFNILSNAFKYSKDGGMVEFSISQENEGAETESYISINVKDNGIGIKSSELEKVFERFYIQNDRDASSMGIGLSLTKDYVEMHKGTIEIESIEKLGTSITIKLPKGKEHFKQEELNEKLDDYIVDVEVLKNTVSDVQTAVILNEKRKELPNILIVEDNKELLDFVANSLHGYYNIEIAENGAEGVNSAREQIPDLIISDVMMPFKNGIELCQELKQDVLTSHIPIILLTAKSLEEDKNEGYKHGADAYISKPFNLKHLIVRIENLIKQRNKLRTKYVNQLDDNSISEEERKKTKIEIPLVEIEVQALDEKFMDRLFEVINSNLTDPSLNMDKICKNLGMNYNQLYRKVKALTNMTVKDLIIKARLKAAANLLLEGKVNVSEAGYLTGFNSPAYFTKAFREQYGLTPTDYIEKNK